MKFEPIYCTNCLAIYTEEAEKLEQLRWSARTWCGPIVACCPKCHWQLYLGIEVKAATSYASNSYSSGSGYPPLPSSSPPVTIRGRTYSSNSSYAMSAIREIEIPGAAIPFDEEKL